MNTETAYELIALHAVAEAGDIYWDSLISEVIINRRSVKIHNHIQTGNDRHPGKGHAPSQLLSRATHAALFLRDSWCASTGEIIWGFTFAYYSDDNFTIDYWYERPDWIAPLSLGESVQGDFED